MSFLVPAFLAGLVAIAIPILVHLTRRQPKESVAFPSLMFLAKIPHKTTQKRKIHRWPLLLLRIAALALLVFAFARPFVDRAIVPELGPGGQEREVVILVDRSYSMATGDRWQRAVDAALAEIDGLTGLDRGTVILFDSRAESASESTTDRAVLRAAVREAEPGIGTTRYAPALRYAARLLTGSSMRRHELVMISDFQASGWQRDVGELNTLRLPEGITIRHLSVANEEQPPANVTVASAEFGRTVVAGRERVDITARLVSVGPAVEVPVTLEINGNVVETQTVSLAENGTANAQFDPLTLPEAGSTRGIVRVPRDALPIDDAFRFVLSSDQRLGVLIVDGPSTPEAASYFLERALAIGSSPGFRAEVRSSGGLRAADLAANDVIILNQAGVPGGEIGDRLRRFVQEGGGLILIVGENNPGSWAGVVPNFGAPVDRSAVGGVTLGFVDTSHPVFEPFAGPRSGDFSTARVYRYRSVPDDAFPRVLAQFADGGAAVAEAAVEGGRVLLMTSTLDGRWNDLPLQPVFLPFIHQLVRYASGYAPARPWLTAGEPFDVSILTRTGEEYPMAVTPSAQQIELDTDEPLDLGEVGFYELRDARGEGRALSLAVNIDPLESNLASIDPAEMTQALMALSQTPVGGTGDATVTLAERERQQRGWWYLIVLAFLLLVAETLLSNRLAPARRDGRLQSGKSTPTLARPRRRAGVV